jgi:hypothetical protein
MAAGNGGVERSGAPGALESPANFAERGGSRRAIGFVQYHDAGHCQERQFFQLQASAILRRHHQHRLIYAAGGKRE